MGNIFLHIYAVSDGGFLQIIPSSDLNLILLSNNSNCLSCSFSLIGFNAMETKGTNIANGLFNSSNLLKTCFLKLYGGFEII